MRLSFSTFFYNAFTIFGLFVLLYNPPILRINIMHIVGVVSWLLVFINAKRIKMCLQLKELFIVYILLFGYLILNTLIHNANYSTTLASVYFILDIIPFGIVFSDYIIRKKKEIKSVLNYFIIAGLIQAIIALLGFFVPSVQSFITDRLVGYGYTNEVSELSYRTFGLSGELTFAMPIIQAVIAIFCLSKRGIVFKLLSFVILISGVINARISIAIYAIGFVTFLIFSKETPKEKIKAVLFFVSALLCGVFIVLPFAKTFSFDTYKWVMDGFKDLSYIFGGEKSNYSYIDYVSDSNNYRLPPSFLSLLFGTGYPSLGFYDKLGFASDIGYINDIWQGGLIYSVVLYCFYLLLMYKIGKPACNCSKWIGLTLIFAMFVANIKGPIFGMNAVTVCVVVLYIFTKFRALKKNVCAIGTREMFYEKNYRRRCIVQQ